MTEICPTCQQSIKIYKRKLNKNMARTLIEMYKAGKYTYHHVPSLPGDTHEASQLAWWALIISSPRRRSDGGHAGKWKLTSAGRLFVEGRITVESHCEVDRGGEPLELMGKQVKISECLGEPFDLRELMNA